MNDSIVCPICRRDVPKEYQEKHHLIPKSRKGKGKGVVKMCCNCGDMVHKLFTVKELAKRFNTVEAILGDDRVRKWADWVGIKPGFSVCMRSKK